HRRHAGPFVEVAHGADEARDRADVQPASAQRRDLGADVEILLLDAHGHVQTPVMSTSSAATISWRRPASDPTWAPMALRGTPAISVVRITTRRPPTSNTGISRAIGATSSLAPASGTTTRVDSESSRSDWMSSRNGNRARVDASGLR